MKIDNKKMVMRLTSILAVFVAVVACVTIPARATAVAYDPADYFTGFTVSGDTKTATYVFEGITPLHRLFYEGVSKGDNSADEFTLTVESGSVEIDSYLMGAVAWYDKPFSSGAIKVSDIMPGADLTFSTRFTFDYTLYGSSGATGDVSMKLTWAFYCYDSDGNFLRREIQDTYSDSWAVSGTNGKFVDSEVTYTVESDCAYILPYVISRWTLPSGFTSTLRGNFEPFSMTCDINMIYENSQTMTAIKNKLTDIDNSIGQTNDKLDGIGDKLDGANDRLDQIINGSDEQKAEADAFDDAMNDAVSDIEDAGDAFDSVDKPWIDFEALVPGELLGSHYLRYIGWINQFWDVETILTMLSILCGFMLISYILYGEKR